MKQDSPTASRALAERFSKLTFEDVPGEGVHEMKRLLTDYLGVAVSGSRTDSGRIAGDFAAELGGPGQATVIGRDVQVPAVHAAFANAVAEHSIELDDVDDEALFHFGPPVMSAALAVAEWRGASGRDVLTAAFAGAEVMNRLSLAANPSLRDRGFHTTPACGVFGAAVAAGHLLGLDTDRLTSALGLAGAQAGGLMEMYGTSMQKRINPGPAARDGVTAAVLALKGFTGADTILDGPRGFGHAFTDRFDTDRLLDGLDGSGRRFLAVLEYKPYSAARPIHNAIDCALAIRAEHASKHGGAADITDVLVERHPAWADYHLVSRPRSYHEAQTSLPYSVAVAFAEGRALPGQYADERLADEAVMGLSERVRVTKDPELPRGVSCRMTVTTRAGERLTAQVDHPKGSVANPLDDTELVDKLLMLAGPVLPEGQAGRLADEVARVESAESLAPLLGLTH